MLTLAVYPGVVLWDHISSLQWSLGGCPHRLWWEYYKRLHQRLNSWLLIFNEEAPISWDSKTQVWVLKSLMSCPHWVSELQSLDLSLSLLFLSLNPILSDQCPVCPFYWLEIWFNQASPPPLVTVVLSQWNVQFVSQSHSGLVSLYHLDCKPVIMRWCLKVLISMVSSES